MTFGEATEQAKQGHKIAREGWNGKNMFVVIMPEQRLLAYNSHEQGLKVDAHTAKFIGNDAPLPSLSYFAMATAQGKWQPGWLASQSDMLSNDWVVVE